MQPASIPDPLIAERTYDTDFIKSVVLTWLPKTVEDCWLNINVLAVYHLQAASP